MNKYIQKLAKWMLIFISWQAYAVSSNISGLWDTIDDKTGQKKAVVSLSENQNIVEGKIIKVFWKQGDHKHCIHCKNDLKNQPIEGMKFLWGLHQYSEFFWKNGQILDPHNGRIYNVNIKQQDDKLFVRAYFGISVLGRTQVWVRHHKE